MFWPLPSGKLTIHTKNALQNTTIATLLCPRLGGIPRAQKRNMNPLNEKGFVLKISIAFADTQNAHDRQIWTDLICAITANKYLLKHLDEIETYKVTTLRSSQ